MWNRGIRRAVERRDGSRRRHGGPGPSGVPRLRLGRRGSARRRPRRDPQEVGQARQPRGRARGRPAPGVDDRHRPHPLGHARRSDRPERPPAPGWRGRQARPHPQRHHRELPRPEAGPARRRRRVHERDRHRGRRAPARRRLRARARPDGRDARRRRRPRGRLHAPRDPRRPARRRRRRPPQQPARGRPRRRCELPRLRRRGVHRPHPPRARAGPGPDRDDHARRCLGHQLRRHAGGGQGLRGHLGCRRRREGRLRDLHGEGDPRPAARRGRHAAGPHRRGRPPRPRRDERLRGAAAGGRPHHHRGLRHRGLRRHGREVRHRALDAHPRRGRARARVPLLRPRSSTTARSSSPSASPARRWTP